MIAIGADHGGFVLKKPIVDYLSRREITCHDYGIYTDEVPEDYPDIVKPVCESIINGQARLGIVLCGTGIGVSIAANKYRGIRAALCTSVEMAILSRKHNDANVLAMGGRIIPVDDALQIVAAWLDASFEDETTARHKRRVSKIEDFEKHEWEKTRTMPK